MKFPRLAEPGRRLGPVKCAAFLIVVCSLVRSAPAQTRMAPSAAMTSLDRYVAAPDTNYGFRELTSAAIPGGKVHILEMTSQSWLTTNEVDRPVWKHWIAVTCPDQCTNRIALLYVTGGSHLQSPPTTPRDALSRTMRDFTRLAIETKSVVAELHDVPNQPLLFSGSDRPRSEDDLIAFAWDKFLRTSDDRWPARLPMTKSVVRAMDTLTAFCATTNGGGIRTDQFVVTGASKRGWTTWSTAAVDKRVVAIVPMVFDALNLGASLRHHYAAYGFWSPAIRSYVEMGIMDWVDTPRFRALAKIEDPYEYLGRFTMPKLILNAGGDQFFLPDSSQFYFDALPGEKYLRYIPNTDHSLKDSDAWETLEVFYRDTLSGAPRPRFNWTLEKDGAIKVTAIDAPKEVRLWRATNPDARDFRLETPGTKWESTPLALTNGTVTARVPEPAKGWTAFMVELTYERAGGKLLKLTTNVRVVPDRTNFKFVPNSPGLVGQGVRAE